MLKYYLILLKFIVISNYQITKSPNYQIKKMAQPKKRKHPRQIHTPRQQKSILYDRIIPVAVIIFMLFGTGITFFAVGSDTTWLIIGGLIGGICGFVFGYLVAKGLTKK